MRECVKVLTPGGLKARGPEGPKALWTRPVEIQISVQAEPVEALPQAQGKRFKLDGGGSINCTMTATHGHTSATARPVHTTDAQS